MPEKLHTIEGFYVPVPGNALAQECVTLCRHAKGIRDWKLRCGFIQSCDSKYSAEQLLQTKSILDISEFLKLSYSFPDPLVLLCIDLVHEPPNFGYEFSGDSLRQLKSAIDGDAPFPFPDDSSHEWLHGMQLWRLSKAERNHSHENMKLLVMEAADQERQKFEKLKRKFAGVAVGERRREPIAESVRIFVWRRDGGKCVSCGSQDRLEYDHVIPFSKGGSSTERNIQLLCEACNRRKSSTV